MLFRLWAGKATTTPVELGGQLLGLVAAAFPDRRVHGVGDAAYYGKALLVPGTTWTTRLPAHASLYDVPPARTGRRGRPALKGAKLAVLATGAVWQQAKVAALRWAQGDAASAETARDLAAIALSHLRCAEPRMVLVGGAPGTGKSTLAAALADRLGAVLLRSDRIRKEDAGMAPEADASSALRTGLYDRATTDATYRTMTARAAWLLGMGESVVLDATWSRVDHRRAAAAVADSARARLEQIRCCAPEGVVLERLAHRSGDVSDVSPGVARVLTAEFEPWPEAVDVNTVGSPDESVTGLVNGLLQVLDLPPAAGTAAHG